MNTITNTDNALNDIKLMIKKIKGLTYHKRSKKFQVQVFFNDSNNIVCPNTKKHTFKSKSFHTLKSALIGRNTIIDFIVNHNVIGNENPITNFNKKTFEDIKTQYINTFNKYESEFEDETGILEPRANPTCYVCLEDIEGDSISICGHREHHICRDCNNIGNLQICGICRTPKRNSPINLQAKSRNDKRREFRNLIE